MSIKIGRKIGFYASLAMLLGTVIGIGIFLKNHSVLRTNNWSGLGTLISWILGGLLSLGAAISFSEISSFETKTIDGPPGWAEKVGGKYFGYFTRFNYGIFYFVILSIAISFFAAETIINIFISNSKTKPHFGLVAIIGVVLLILFFSMNYISIKTSGIVQQISTIIKFIPLISVILGGIIMATTNFHPVDIKDIEGNKPIFGHNAFTNGRKFDFTKVLASLPAVLFAYDSFLVTTQLRHKMQKPQKLPFIVLIGMILVIVVYSLIAISAILHGSGMLSGQFFGESPKIGLGIFDQIMNFHLAKVFGILMLIFICVSTLGVLNGISAGTITMIEQIITSNTLFGLRFLKKKIKDRFWIDLIVIIILFIFGFLLVGLPAIIINSDGYVDAISNFPTLFMFAIYGFIILLYTIKRNKQQTIKISNILFNIMSWIAIIGIFFIVAYQIFYGMSINLILSPDDNSNAGLFWGNDRNFKNIELCFLFFITLSIFIGLPFINYLLIKYIEKRNPIQEFEISKIS